MDVFRVLARPQMETPSTGKDHVNTLVISHSYGKWPIYPISFDDLPIR